MRGVLYLASTSPRRGELLDRAGIEFRLHPPGPECEGSGEPRERAQMRARSKDSDDWTDKAGGYGIQSEASRFMELIEGDLDTVIGLNIATVLRLLARDS